MDDKALEKPEHVNEADWYRHLHWMALMGKHVSENYAAHLARVTQDADHSKALLHAHYKARHHALHTPSDASGSLFDKLEK